MPKQQGNCWFYPDADQDVDGCPCCKVTLLIPAQFADAQSSQGFFLQSCFLKKSSFLRISAYEGDTKICIPQSLYSAANFPQRAGYQ